MAVAVFDTVLALLAGMAIYPIIMANNLAPAAGPGLLFISMPYAFGNMPQGEWFGSLFFALTVVMALASAVALMEPAVRLLQQQFRLRRLTAATTVGALAWLLAWMVVFSVAGDARSGSHGQANLLTRLDFVTANVLLPLVCLLTVVLVGWGLRTSVLRPQMARESAVSFSLWQGILRYIAPPAIVLVLLAGLIL